MSSLWEIMAKEYAAAQRKLDEDEERLLAALRGEPFWRHEAGGEVVGLAEWIRGDVPDLNAVLMNLKPPEVTK